MATVTGLTAQRMLEIEAASVVDGDVVGPNLILTRHDGSQINAGPVVGPAGPQGPAGIAKVAIPGSITLWPSMTLPNLTEWGKYTWANGDIFDIATYPKAAANIDDVWNTAMGLATPGAGKFRVPDLRGLAIAAPDAMPSGAARANRLTRSVALTIATRTGEETHVITVPELAVHTHIQNQHLHLYSHDHGLAMAQGGVISSSSPYPVGGSGPAAIEGGNNASNPIKAGSWNTGYTTPTNQNTGGGAGHENVQPTIFVPYIVKLDD